ncbi:MAG: hypothetical protein WCG16_13140 [Methylococcales bacterium]
MLHHKAYKSIEDKENYAIVIPEVDDLQEIKVMFGDRLELWAEGIKAEAILGSSKGGVVHDLFSDSLLAV